MRYPGRFGLLALSALLGGALLGCGGTRPEDTPAPRPAGTDRPASVAEAPVRLDDAALGLATNSGTFPDRQYLVASADEAATRRCMRAAGVTWSGYVPRPPAGTDEERMLDLADRRRRGYGLSEPDGDGAGLSGPDGGAAGEPARGGAGRGGAAPEDGTRVRQALFGPSHRLAQLTVTGIGVVSYPVEGCVAEAHAAVFGDVRTWARLTYLPPGVNLNLAKAVRAEPRYRDAERAWSRCMAEHGQRYATPDDIRRELGKRYETDRQPLASRRDAEIALALQDAACNQRVRLAGTELELRREAAQRLDPGQRAELAELTVRLDEAVARARSLP